MWSLRVKPVSCEGFWVLLKTVLFCCIDIYPTEDPTFYSAGSFPLLRHSLVSLNGVHHIVLLVTRHSYISVRYTPKREGLGGVIHCALSRLGRQAGNVCWFLESVSGFRALRPGFISSFHLQYLTLVTQTLAVLFRANVLIPDNRIHQHFNFLIYSDDTETKDLPPQPNECVF